jgi:hypothetical protein
MSAIECNTCVGKHVAKPEDKKVEAQRRSTRQAAKRSRAVRGKVMIKGPVTMAHGTPAPEGHPADGTGIVTLRKSSTRTVLFAPEAEIIPDPEDEGVGAEDPTYEIEVEVVDLIGDGNGQLVKY